MRFITKNDIESWSKSYESKGNLPTLISRLVRATTPLSTETDFPDDSGVYSGGYDGTVNCEERRGLVPEGKSVWEFGTTKTGVTKKANEDYTKRTADALGYDPKECTFVFLTPSFWRDKDTWKDQKIAESIWKDVKAYDSRNIVEWLDKAPGTAKWFAGYLGKVQEDGTQTTEEFWDEWSKNPKYSLPVDLITCGRDNEVKQIYEFLRAKESILGVKASTKEEAIAFIVCAVKQFDASESERFFSKSLIVETQGQFRVVGSNFQNPLNLIPRFQEQSAIYNAVSKGHHVLVPLGPDDDFTLDAINLPRPDRDGQVSALINMGLDREEAEKYLHESGQNITILKRMLKFPTNKYRWSETADHREILPALLLGRWNETLKGDREVIERLSGKSYEEYDEVLQKWKNYEASPLLKIGETWRLTSPLTAWADFSAKLLKKDFENLKKCFLYAFENGNPDVEHEDHEARKYLTKKKLFSGWAREGLVQSLILIGLFGKNLQISKINDPQIWVDTIISDLLSNADDTLWVSINRETPLIAEASPNKFLEALEIAFSKEVNPILAMFEEVSDGLFSSTSNHTGLLWGLESLAWLPDYFHRATLILLQLANVDPGGRLSNRPINSLVEIFKPWHFQTLVSYEERTEVLKNITSKIENEGWKLLMRLLPERSGVAHPTHKLRWRMFEENTSLQHSYYEQNKTYSFIVDLLVSRTNLSEEQIAELIDESVRFFSDDRKKVLEYSKKHYLNRPNRTSLVWETLGKIITKHSAFSETSWALPEVDLLLYEELYYQLEPGDTLEKYTWLFNDNWPQIPKKTKSQTSRGRNLDQEQEDVNNARNHAVKKIVEQYGTEKIIELAYQVKYPGSLGFALASIEAENSTFLVLNELNASTLPIDFIQSFVVRKAFLNGTDWVFNEYTNRINNNPACNNLAQLFLPLIQTRQIWDFLSNTTELVQKEYWISMRPHFYQLDAENKEFGIRKLMHYERNVTALNTIAHFPKELSTELLIEGLIKAGTESSNENARLESYYIGEVFSELDQRPNVDRKILIQLEWLYLQILGGYGSQRTPKILHDELAKNPEFFVEILKYVFVGKEKSTDEHKVISEDVLKMRATQGFQLLYRWKQIPGLKDDGTIDEKVLNEWVEQARELAKKVDRLNVADMQIATVLAQYPETPGTLYPPEEISRLIEKINTKSIKSNYSSALFNKRGSSSRGVFDGGDIERGHATYFQELAKMNRFKYPNIAEIFTNLAKGYLIDAKRQDESAERDRLEY